MRYYFGYGEDLKYNPIWKCHECIYLYNIGYAKYRCRLKKCEKKTI